MNKKRVFSIIIIFICFLLVGCGKYDIINENNNNFPPINPLPDDKIELILYYPNSTKDYLVPELRVVPRENEYIEKMAINELLKGTKDNNLATIIPENTRVLSLYVTDNIAYVSFSKDLIEKSYNEKEEAFIIYSIVNTLTSLPEIEEVQILIDGKSENVLYKHYSIKEPLNFSDMIVTKNYISPASIVNEYYNSIIDENYDKAMKMLDLGEVNKIRYNTIKAYIINEFKGISQFNINKYIIDEYEDELNINMSITFTYEKNNIKTSRKSCKLIYNDDTLLIKGL